MKLRTILLLISLLAVLSAATGGSLYYSALRESAFNEADRRAATRVKLLRKTISSHLSENVEPVRVLAGMDQMLEMLVRPNSAAQDRANAVLDLFKESLNVDVCYLMNYKGDTIASSNRNAPDSFVGKNFAFRPYFQQAIHSAPATYLALGVTSKKRGAYYSYPVFEKGGDTPIGLAVIKVSIDLIESELGLSPDEVLLVADPRGVVFISNRKQWLYRLLKPLAQDEIEQITASRQFGKGPWKWSGLKFVDSNQVIDLTGERYLQHSTDLENHAGWQIIHLRSMRAITQTVVDPIIRITGPIVLSLCGFIGLAVFLLYRKARVEILERHKIENALRESEERYRGLYHHTPAMLHSIDPKGRIVSISNYWSDVMGYSRDEVIGQELTRFFTADSQQYARDIVFPQFFRDGFCRDIPYQFIKKDGETIDVLLSAIVDRDREGNIHRTLAVSIDITERKRTEEQLQLAKEELSRYSKDLERQVRKRTSEIHNILTYTPAVIYMKDNTGRYTLVNAGYELLFGLTNDRVNGKTDSEVLPKAVADQFEHSDQKVLSERRSYHVEEHIHQMDGEHTYLSVKFPIYDHTGAVSGICGILNDITAVKKAQDQLRRLSGSIMANQEKERAALARELHDELGQVLTALRMDAVWLHDRLKKIDPPAAKRALTMCQLIDKEIDEVRSMTFRLRPGVLDDLGLVDALEWYTTDFERRTEITCIFDHSDIPVLGDTVATAAYRITQEALTNVARHAKASRVEVQLQADNGTLILAVKDDGNGFDALNLSESEGLGIAGMRERAALVGASLEVHSEQGVGTEVYLKVPFDGLVSGPFGLLSPLGQFGPNNQIFTLRLLTGNGHNPAMAGLNWPNHKFIQGIRMIKVLLADDHSIVRAGLRRIIEESGEIEVIAEAADGREAIQMVRESSPDVAVVDISMPEVDGLEVINQLQAIKPNIPILILTMHEEGQYVVRAIEAGAMGYITKQSAPEQLVNAIRKIHAGSRYLTDEAAEALALRIAKGSSGATPLDTLSMRELQVLRRLAMGQTNREIARSYHISIKTVDTYRARLLKKLDLRNNADLSRFAMQNNLIE